jgi:hypothetical protein
MAVVPSVNRQPDCAASAGTAGALLTEYTEERQLGPSRTARHGLPVTAWGFGRRGSSVRSSAAWRSGLSSGHGLLELDVRCSARASAPRRAQGRTECDQRYSRLRVSRETAAETRLAAACRRAGPSRASSGPACRWPRDGVAWMSGPSTCGARHPLRGPALRSSSPALRPIEARCHPLEAGPRPARGSPSTVPRETPVAGPRGLGRDPQLSSFPQRAAARKKALRRSEGVPVTLSSGGRKGPKW